jgi:hypothetical protein
MTINRVWVAFGAMAVGIIAVPGPGQSQVCPPTPGVCRTALSSVFTFKNRADDNNDKLVWRWLKGEATDVSEFLDPTTTVTSALCLYAGSTAALIGEATIPPSATLWHVGNSFGADGLKIWYKDPSATQDGVHYVLLRSGGTGGARIIIKARGVGTPDVATPFPMGDLPLIVQFHQDDGAPCWGSTFTTRKVNHASKFKAKSP